MNWSQARRSDFIAWRLFYHGTLSRKHIMDAFIVSHVQASADIAVFNADHPEAMYYDTNRKEYVANKHRKPWRQIDVDRKDRLIFTVE